MGFDSATEDTRTTLVIGDVHGHLDRFERLLQKAGILGPCPNCDGTGDVAPIFTIEGEAQVGRDAPVVSIEGDAQMCPDCDGDGQVRVDFDTRVIQLGDLGHFGGAEGSPTGDHLCYLYAIRWQLDLILWGNHDRQLVDPGHICKGFQHPGRDTKLVMEELHAQGRLKMATSAQGFLITHAGVPLGFRQLVNAAPSAAQYAAYLNYLDDEKIKVLAAGGMQRHDWGTQHQLQKKFRAIDAISHHRKGHASEGGCLWMDWEQEKHLRGEPFRYICGHTPRRDGQVHYDKWGNWNVDIGGKTEARLAGLWLDDGEVQDIVRVDL